MSVPSTLATARSRITRYDLSRRAFLKMAGCGVVGVALAGCGGMVQDQASESGETSTSVAPQDFSERFAGYDAAEEPNGDLSMVVWPTFVTRAGPEVRRLYEFQITNGELMRYMPCFCGCGADDGHRNNRDCYVRQVNPDGSVVLDSMAPT